MPLISLNLGVKTTTIQLGIGHGVIFEETRDWCDEHICVHYHLHARAVSELGMVLHCPGTEFSDAL